MSARERHPDGPAIRVAEAVRQMAEDGAADAAGRARPAHRPMRVVLVADDPKEQEAIAAAAEARDEARRQAEWERYLETPGEDAGENVPAQDDGAWEDVEGDDDDDDEGDLDADVA
jgi:hypothetical protein